MDVGVAAAGASPVPEYVPAPSEVLDPAQLDQALLVLVIRQDGTAYSSTYSTVDRDALAGWVRDFADRLAEHTCEACETGVPHNHADEA